MGAARSKLGAVRKVFSAGLSLATDGWSLTTPPLHFTFPMLVSQHREALQYLFQRAAYLLLLRAINPPAPLVSTAPPPARPMRRDAGKEPSNRLTNINIGGC